MHLNKQNMMKNCEQSRIQSHWSQRYECNWIESKNKRQRDRETAWILNEWEKNRIIINKIDIR